ncbi:MAG: alpha/beta fold hydrolase [Microthrixaceae bacterium]
MTSPHSTDMRTVMVHGHEVAYRTGGSGPVVLLVHGMAGSSDTWRPSIPLLEAHVTYVAPDLPGHGRSDKPRGDYSLGAQASFLRDLLTALGHDRATIVGQSLGGGIALQFAYQYPERCERLVLVCAGGLGQEVNPVLRLLTLPGVDMLLPLAFQPIYRTVVDGFAGVMRRIGLQPTPVALETWRSYCSLIDPETRSAFISTLTAVVDRSGQRVSAHDRLYLASALPTLIVWGDSDPIIPVEHAHDTHQAIPGSQLEILPGAGHYPHCEDPQRFAELLVEFVGSTEAAQLTTAEFARQLASTD